MIFFLILTGHLCVLFFFLSSSSHLLICVFVFNFRFAPISWSTHLIQMFQELSYVQIQVPTFCLYQPLAEAISGLDYISVFPKQKKRGEKHSSFKIGYQKKKWWQGSLTSLIRHKHECDNSWPLVPSFCFVLFISLQPCCRQDRVSAEWRHQLQGAGGSGGGVCEGLC